MTLGTLKIGSRVNRRAPKLRPQMGAQGATGKVGDGLDPEKQSPAVL